MLAETLHYARTEFKYVRQLARSNLTYVPSTVGKLGK